MERLREELKASRAAKAEAAKMEKAASADVQMGGTAESGEPDDETKPQSAINGSLAAESTESKTKDRISPSPTPVAAKAKVRSRSPSR